MSFQALFDFESALAEYTGAPYVVLTDGCTHALELCFRHDNIQETAFSAFTYLSVPMLMHHLGVKFTLTDEIWNGEYQFHGTRIWDSARRLLPDMYRPGQFQCLSFGWTKPLQLGKVGAILLDDYEAYKKFSRQRSDGRDLHIPWQSETELILGWHYCPTLELCERGLDMLPTVPPQSQQVEYPDLRKIPFDLAKNLNKLYNKRRS
jgi:DegT/DnrJ/EryC1/StrS aminotransferase family